MSCTRYRLPAPRHTAARDDDGEDEGALDAGVAKLQQQAQALSVAKRSAVPPYGQRRAWRPKTMDDYGDGGSYPECHVAQYPLEMGRKNKVCPGDCTHSTLQLGVAWLAWTGCQTRRVSSTCACRPCSSPRSSRG